MSTTQSKSLPELLWTFEATIYSLPGRPTQWVTSTQRFRSMREASAAADGFIQACRGYGISAVTGISEVPFQLPTPTKGATK